MYLQVFGIGLLAAMSPGPDFFLVMRNTLAKGRAAGVATALGIAAGLTVHVAYTLAGFALLLDRMPLVFALVQLAGAAYLLHLGIGAMRSAPRGEQSLNGAQAKQSHTDTGFWTGFRQGFICNVLNPKAPVFFVSVFSRFLDPQTPLVVELTYGALMVLAVGLWFTTLASFVSVRRFRSLYWRAGHWVDRLLGVALAGFALSMLWELGHMALG